MERFYRYLNENRDLILTGHRYLTPCLESNEVGIDEAEREIKRKDTCLMNKRYTDLRLFLDLRISKVEINLEVLIFSRENSSLPF